MENQLPNEILIFGLIFGAILLIWGCFRIKKGSNGWNLISLILNGQASGIGQFLSGLLLIIAVIVMFFMKKNGII